MELTIDGITSTYWIDYGLTQIVLIAYPNPMPNTTFQGALVYAPFDKGCYYLYNPGQTPINLGPDYYTAKANLQVLARSVNP